MWVMVNLSNFYTIWRRLHWCWLTKHICSLFLAQKDIQISWKITMNRLFIQDKSFFITDKRDCAGWILNNYFPHIWRRLHWCWLTAHICSLFLGKEDIPIIWNLAMNRLFIHDKSFFVTEKKRVFRVNFWKFSRHLATSRLMLADRTHLKFVLRKRGRTHELKSNHE